MFILFLPNAPHKPRGACGKNRPKPSGISKKITKNFPSYFRKMSFKRRSMSKFRSELEAGFTKARRTGADAGASLGVHGTYTTQNLLTMEVAWGSGIWCGCPDGRRTKAGRNSSGMVAGNNQGIGEGLDTEPEPRRGADEGQGICGH